MIHTQAKLLPYGHNRIQPFHADLRRRRLRVMLRTASSLRCSLYAGSGAGCVDDERDPVLEALLTRCVYHRDFQPVAADAQIGR
jgi:hypothetical protein